MVRCVIRSTSQYLEHIGSSHHASSRTTTFHQPKNSRKFLVQRTFPPNFSRILLRTSQSTSTFRCRHVKARIRSVVKRVFGQYLDERISTLSPTHITLPAAAFFAYITAVNFVLHSHLSLHTHLWSDPTYIASRQTLAELDSCCVCLAQQSVDTLCSWLTLAHSFTPLYYRE